MYFDEPYLPTGTFFKGEDPPVFKGDPVSASDAFTGTLHPGGDPVRRGFLESDLYDKRNDDIYQATGEKLWNPTRDVISDAADDLPGVAKDPTTEALQQGRTPEAYQKRLEELAKKYPDKAHIIKSDKSIFVEAQELTDQQRASDASLTARQPLKFPGGIPGIGGSGPATIASSLVNTVTDPILLPSLFFWQGKAAVGIKGMATAAAKNAAVAAAGTAAEVPLNHFMYESRAGVEWSWEQYLKDVANSAAAGAELDVGFRSAFRGVRRIQGRVPVLDEHGNVAAWVRPEDVPKPASPPPKGITATELKGASEGNVEALRAIGDKTGLHEDPEFRGAVNTLETHGPASLEERLTREGLGISDRDWLRSVDQALRAAEGEDVPPVHGFEPVAEKGADFAFADAEKLSGKYANEVAGLRAGLDQVNPKLSQLVQDALDAGLPEILPALEARLESLRRGANPENAVAAFAKAAAELGEHYPVLAAIKAGTAHPLEIARALKQGLQLDGQVSSTGPVVLGKSLARLSDDAFARVESGEIAPDLAQAVADRVGDKDLHSGLFDDLKKAGADTPERAREILPDLLPHPGTGPTDVLLGVRRGDMPDFDSLITDNIEDPMGPQAKKQTERMAQDLAPEIAEAQALGPARPMTATPEDVAAGAAGVRDAIADVAGTPRLAGEITRTTDLPGYGTPEFEARRAFNFPGETVVGYAAAEQKLFEHASWFAGGPVAHDRQIIVLLGPPGSGKSTIAKPLAKATKSAYISADDAKAVLPEYDGGKNAQGVHSESTKITDGVTNRALASGANFIIEKLGRNAASIERHVQEWKQRGYTVKVVAVSAERGELAARIESRAAQDGRVIDLSIVDQTLNALPEVLDRARKSADFAGVMEVDNSGSAPKIISGKDLFGHDARRAIEDGAALRQPGMVLLDRGSIDRAADRSQQGLAGREGGAGHGQDAARITLDDSLRDMAGTILPPGTAVKTFSSIDELPKGLRDEVIAGNAHVLAAAERRFRTAKTDAARDAARLVLDDAKAGRGIEGIAHDGVIYIATYALDPRGRLAHEAVHWLKEAGKLTPGEISILAARARETGVFGPERAALYRQELKSRGFSSGRVAETVPRTRGAEPIMRL